MWLKHYNIRTCGKLRHSTLSSKLRRTYAWNIHLIFYSKIQSFQHFQCKYQSVVTWRLRKLQKEGNTKSNAGATTYDNLFHNSSIWWVIIGRRVSPHGPTITRSPTTTLHMGQLWHKLYHKLWHKLYHKLWHKLYHKLLHQY